MMQSVRPKVGLLALTLELYETLLPDLRASREGWLRRAVIPALQREADILFTRAVFRREDIEAAVGEFIETSTNMGLTAEKLFTQSGLSKEAMDRWGARAHQLASKAYQEGFLKMKSSLSKRSRRMERL